MGICCNVILKLTTFDYFWGVILILKSTILQKVNFQDFPQTVVLLHQYYFNDDHRHKSYVSVQPPITLGPFLFLAFINDMPECVKSRCRLFADDSIIYRKIMNDGDADTLQKDLDALQKWESDWGMSFNPSKCNVIHVSRKKQPSDHAQYLKENMIRYNLFWKSYTCYQ